MTNEEIAAQTADVEANEAAIALIREMVDGTIFGATFRKRDGTLRSGSFRLGVRKELTGAGSAYDRASRGNLTVYDMTKQAYRTIRLAALVELNYKGKTVTLPGEDV